MSERALYDNVSLHTKHENPALEKLMTSACFFLPVNCTFNAQVRTSHLTGEVVSYCFEVSLMFQTSLESLESISIKFHQEGRKHQPLKTLNRTTTETKNISEVEGKI